MNEEKRPDCSPGLFSIIFYNILKNSMLHEPVIKIKVFQNILHNINVVKNIEVNWKGDFIIF